MNAKMVYLIIEDEHLRARVERALSNAGIKDVLTLSSDLNLHGRPFSISSCFVLDANFIEITRFRSRHALCREFEEVPFLCLMSDGKVSTAVELMKLGAMAVVALPFDDELFVKAVKEAMEIHRQKYLMKSQRDSIRMRIDVLTSREREVADLVVQGLLTKQIAKALGICVKTVEVHRSHITKKLRVDSVAQLVRLFMEAGDCSQVG
jgi:FixJ family two-component response regulator